MHSGVFRRQLRERARGSEHQTGRGEVQHRMVGAREVGEQIGEGVDAELFFQPEAAFVQPVESQGTRLGQLEQVP
jgi:hypothetical protein